VWAPRSSKGKRSAPSNGEGAKSQSGGDPSTSRQTRLSVRRAVRLATAEPPDRQRSTRALRRSGSRVAKPSRIDAEGALDAGRSGADARRSGWRRNRRRDASLWPARTRPEEHPPAHEGSVTGREVASVARTARQRRPQPLRRRSRRP
jgi:hypothetical protein